MPNALFACGFVVSLMFACGQFLFVQDSIMGKFINFNMTRRGGIGY